MKSNFLFFAMLLFCSLSVFAQQQDAKDNEKKQNVSTRQISTNENSTKLVSKQDEQRNSNQTEKNTGTNIENSENNDKAVLPEKTVSQTKNQEK